MREWISIKEKGPPIACTPALFTDGRDNVWCFYANLPREWATHYLIPPNPPVPYRTVCRSKENHIVPSDKKVGT